VVDQFSDFMILVLIAAAVISGVVGDLVDTLVILVIVLLNAAIGLVQAWRADQALAALQRLSAALATVLRSGQVQQVPAHVLVPGDIVLLEAGNKVPADLRLIEIAQLKVDESALTGESVTVDKHAGVLMGTVHALGDRLNMAFKGTTATHGRGRGLVVATAAGPPSWARWRVCWTRTTTAVRPCNCAWSRLASGWRWRCWRFAV
jgi:Ca2+-transporting ATPase